MAHEIAKSILEKAKSDSDRAKAIGVAIQLGMPLNEIQDYLDWIDHMRANNPKSDSPGDSDAE